MTKQIPVPVKMAQQVLKSMRAHPDFDILKKNLPAFAMQYATKKDLTLEILSSIASQGADALVIEQNDKKTEKTYQSIVKNLPEKKEDAPQEAPRRTNIRDAVKEMFYPALTPYVMQFIMAWEQQDGVVMQNALRDLDTAIKPCNKKIMEMEGAYDFHQLNSEDLLRSAEKKGVCVSSRLRQYAENGDLDHLKLFQSILPDMRVGHFTIPMAAYNTQIEVLEYHLKELEYDYPMRVDDYYSEDYIIKKVLEQGDLETFKYLIDNEYSGDAYIHYKGALTNSDFFDYGFDYMHQKEHRSENYLRNVVTHGTFDQVKKIIEAGKYLANGDIKDNNNEDRFHSNPMPYALYKAKNIALFTYLRENTPKDLDQEEIQHTMSMLLMGGDYNIADFLYETYQDDFTTDFLHEEFSNVSRNFFNSNGNEDNVQEFTDSAACYFLKKFGKVLDKSVLDEVVSSYFYRTTVQENLLEEALQLYPYDTQDIWDCIILGIEKDPSFSRIEDLQAYDMGDVSNETYIGLRSKVTAYEIGKAQIETIIKMMDQAIPVATAGEWQNHIKHLSCHHKPVFDEILKHLKTHPLKKDIFTADFAKDIVVKGVGDNEYGAFDLIDQVVRFCPVISDDAFMACAQNDAEIDQTEKFLEKRQLKNNWSKQHLGAPYSLLDFSPFLHQPKAFSPLVEIFEKEEGLDRQSAEKYAYQVAGLFGSMPRVLSYLEKWGHATKQPLHDIAHSLMLPKTGRFDKSAWGDAVIKHGPKMAEMVHFANRMAQPEKSSDGKAWSYQKTFERASEFVYAHSDKDMDLAKLCHGLKMSEDSFENARKIVGKFNELSQKKSNKPNQHIPEIGIEGASFGKEGYKFMRLETGDLRGLFLGAMTGCCQWIGGIGSDCAEHGFKSPNGGFYVITNPDNQIVSQAWAWRGRNGEIVLDSIETLGTHVDKKEWQSICNLMARDFAGNYKDITALHIGTGGQTPKFDYAETKAAKPIDKLGYSDAGEQVIVWKRSDQIKSVI